MNSESTAPTRLKFGYFLNAEYPPRTDARTAMRNEQDTVRHCADIGLDSVFVGEHFSHGSAMWLPPVPLLSRLCDTGVDLDFGTAVLVAPLHNPVVLAEQIALLDRLCGGRFTLGVSAGWNLSEFAALGIQPRKRGSRLTEAVTILRQLWGSDGPSSFAGRHYSFDDIDLALRPARPGGPPIWIGASGPKGLARAAEIADAWVLSSHAPTAVAIEQSRMYAAELAARGRPRPSSLTALRNIYVAPTHEQAVREAAPYVTASYNTFGAWGLFREVLDEHDAVDYDMAAKRVIVGAPEEVAELVIDFMRAAGVGHLLARVQWIGMPPENIRRCLTLFADEVVPRVRAALTPTIESPE